MEKLVDIAAFRRQNKLTQQQLAEFFRTSRSFLSLVESGRNKLPDNLIDQIYCEGINLFNWDVSQLNPCLYRLYCLAKEKEYRDTSCPISLNWETGDSILPISIEEMLLIKHGKTGITDKIKKRILDRYPDVNEDWLLFGTGSMLGNNKEQDSINKNDREKQLGAIIDKLDALLQKLNDIETKINVK